MVVSSLVFENRYKVISTVKSGGMGAVYKALDLRLSATVALKQMLCQSTRPDEIAYAEKRFEEEARLLSSLHHGGLPKVTDYFSAKDPATGRTARFLVMTFIDGRDLETIISERKQKPFPVNDALGYFGQILDILNYLHTHNPRIVYRDIKPSNIMLDQGRIVLIDFGIARIFSAQNKGTTIGTPGYTAPEQYRGAAEPRSDIYSLGVVMHYLLTGADPQNSSLPLFNFRSVRQLNPNVPDYLDSLIMSMLEVVPDNRPCSAKRIIEILNSRISKTASPVPAIQSVSVQTTAQSASSNRQSISGRKLKYGTIIEAVNNGDIEEVRLFLNKGTYVNCRAPDGNTLLHRAVIVGCKDIVELLIQNGADINARGRDGLMPLHFASANGLREVVILLVSMGADIYARSIKGETPLDKAEENNHGEIADFLRKAGGVKQI